MIFSSFMLNDIFCENLYMIQYIPLDKIMNSIWDNTCLMKYGLLKKNLQKNEAWHIFEIKSQYLIIISK